MSEYPQSTDPQHPGDSEYIVASLYKRFSAFCIDVLAMAISVMPAISYFDIRGMVEKNNGVPAEIAIALIAYQLVMFFVLHGFWLHRYGQTLGKRLINIAIVGLDNRKLTFMALILNRYLPQWAVGCLPGFGLILRCIDILFIFRDKDRRCVHDLIAGTKVIDLSIAISIKPNSILA